MAIVSFSAFMLYGVITCFKNLCDNDYFSKLGGCYDIFPHLCICILFLICGPVGRHWNFPDFCVSEHHCLRRSVLVLSCVDHVLVWRVGLEVMCHSNACLWG